MELQFPESDIPSLAKKYCEYWFTSEYTEQAKLEQELINMREAVCAQNYLTKDILRKVATWVSRRRVALIKNNSENTVREITGYALQSKDERVRRGDLNRLDGVGVATATAILHFFHKDPYPFLSENSAKSVGERKIHLSSGKNM